MNKHEKTVYTGIDARMKTDRKKRIAWAESEGYEYYSHAIKTLYKKESAKAIIQRIADFGAKPPSLNAFCATIKETNSDLENRKKKNPKKKVCKTDGCNRYVARGNFWHCSQCFRQINERASIFETDYNNMCF